jgi:hypothetical protein
MDELGSVMMNALSGCATLSVAKIRLPFTSQYELGLMLRQWGLN